ncbi:MAG: hypothetical protein KC421_27835 [Anaerolineales bacterium]|nr:hypothetical protein [Anaerolineales bacterium]
MNAALGNSFRIHNKKLPDFDWIRTYAAHRLIGFRLPLNRLSPAQPPPKSTSRILEKRCAIL